MLNSVKPTSVKPLSIKPLNILRRCGNCERPYDPKHSSSNLRLQFCELQCEIRVLGFSLSALERNEIVTKTAVASGDWGG